MSIHLIILQIASALVVFATDEDLELWNLWPESTDLVSESNTTADIGYCPGLADVIFLVDSNTRVQNKQNTVKNIKQIMMDVVESFQQVGLKGVQIAALYSDKNAETNFFLDSYGDADGYKHGIILFNPTFNMVNGDTGLQNWILKIRNTYFNSDNGGGRPCAKPMIVIISDGRTPDLTDTVHELKHLKFKDVIVIAIAVGDADTKALTDMASDGYVFRADDPTTSNKTVDILCKDPPCFGKTKKPNFRTDIENFLERELETEDGSRGQGFIDEAVIDSDELRDETLSLANNQVPPFPIWRSTNS